MMSKITLKVKVMGSKVKVKLMILRKICLAYKSCTIGCRDTKMNTHVQYDNFIYLYQAQGYRLVCWAVCPSVRWSVTIERFPL